ncbi:RDD family protein [Yimella sp. NH-Cas1]|uniref:RDD family protein n=1 Tax=Yimella sp. NH-Cas1 TaxID=2917726 RepID=UPI001EFB3E62|nr:RDD family protein [Yimella sp. NH-Cas1]MCG8654761.1 RDD family protein [Yimella sp. NH-Cas1]
MSERASGWYPDPNDPDTLRYWDGILWTDRTMPRVKPGLEKSHISAAPQVPQHHQHPHLPHPGQHRPGQQQSSPNGPYRGRFQPASATARTPDGAELAPFWRRALAFIVDNILTSAIAAPLAWPWLSDWVHVVRTYFNESLDAAREGRGTPDAPDALYNFPWQVGLVAVAVYFVYEVALTVWRGQTVGKMLLGIKVRREENDKPPTFGAAVYRFAVKQLTSIVGPVPLLSFLVTIFQIVDYLRPLSDRMNQAFHDSWPGTYVVRKQRGGASKEQTPPGDRMY